MDAACNSRFASPQTGGCGRLRRCPCFAIGRRTGIRQPRQELWRRAGTTRRTLEADRFGFVAHVLETRGCTPEDCAAFKLLRYASRVKTNLKDHAFEAHVTQYAANWPAGSVATAVVASPVPSAIALPPSPSTTSSVSRFNFPSSASIPPVSIMSAEPTGSTSPNNASAEPPTPEKPPARRQSASKPAAASSRLPPPPAPPAPRTQ